MEEISSKEGEIYMAVKKYQQQTKEQDMNILQKKLMNVELN